MKAQRTQVHAVQPLSGYRVLGRSAEGQYINAQLTAMIYYTDTTRPDTVCLRPVTFAEAQTGVDLTAPWPYRDNFEVLHGSNPISVFRTSKTAQAKEAGEDVII